MRLFSRFPRQGDSQPADLTSYINSELFWPARGLQVLPLGVRGRGLRRGRCWPGRRASLWRVDGRWRGRGGRHRRGGWIATADNEHADGEHVEALSGQLGVRSPSATGHKRATTEEASQSNKKARAR